MPERFYHDDGCGPVPIWARTDIREAIQQSAWTATLQRVSRVPAGGPRGKPGVWTHSAEEEYQPCAF